MLLHLTYRCHKQYARIAAAVVTLVILGLQWNVIHAQTAPDPEGIEFFEKHVRPLFAEHCQSCHGEKKQEAGLRLDTSAAVAIGSDSGPVIVAGDPAASTLFKAILYGGDIEMPPDGRLPDKAIETIATWIQLGAPWPQDVKTAAVADPKTHWAFQPVRKPHMPVVDRHQWIKSPVDAYILQRLEAAGLTPSEPADRRTLIRRAYFDLHGLPPTPQEVLDFERDQSPLAFEKVVDRLLASPRYGERWGRFWLDVARYADTKGYVRLRENPKYASPWTYRDYVIRALNVDVPYDRLILEQLAADQLEFKDNPQILAALGFLTLGPRFINSQPDIIDDRIDVVTRGLLGLTVNCARCHDHKFDPIPTEDYYSLYGVFASCVEPRVPPILLRPGDEWRFADYLTELSNRTRAFDEFLVEQQRQLSASFRARASEYLYAGQHEEVQPNFLAVMFLIDSSKELNPVVVQRWARLLAHTRKHSHPVLGPWNALAQLPQGQFAEHARGLLQTWCQEVEPPTFNSVVVAALNRAAPRTLAEVAECYGQVFQEVERRWQELLQKQPDAKQLAEPEWESIRQLLYAADSPCAVAVDEVEEFLFVDTNTQNMFNDQQRQVEDWIMSHGAAPHAMVLNDRREPVEPRVFIRGNASNPGDAVPRAFLSILCPPERIPFQSGSGRLELAQAIADENNPLTARVFMNRVWMHHFGSPLVRTPSDFGLRSEPPTHPELLDYLAWRFMAEDWSIKKMHRVIMLSAVYQQQSLQRDECAKVDPENELLWKANRRRLDWESLRDSLLASSGDLEFTVGGPSVELFSEPRSRRRTVYGFVDRQNLAGVYRTFDFFPPDATSPQRYETTVPQQALFLMNNVFMKERARQLAITLQLRDQSINESQVNDLHLRLFGRAAETDDIRLAKGFLTSKTEATVSEHERPSQWLTAWEEYAQALLLSNEFVFID